MDVVSDSTVATYTPKAGVQRLHCSACGSPIAYLDERLPDEIYFYLGVVDQQAELVPMRHAWVSEQLSWLNIADHLPVHEGFSRDRSLD